MDRNLNLKLFGVDPSQLTPLYLFTLFLHRIIMPPNKELVQGLMK